MKLNYEFTKNEGILLVNIAPLVIIGLVIVIAFIGINEYTSFYEGILTILLISIYSPLGLILFGMVAAYLYIVGDLIVKIYKKEKAHKNNEIVNYSKIERNITILEIINVIILIIGYCYIFFIAQPEYDKEVQNSRNESIINMRYETNSELTKFKCEILPKNDSTKNLKEAVRLSKAGKIKEATKQLEWAIEKLEIQRDFLKKMKTPDNEWKRSISDVLTITIDNKDIDKIVIFKDDINNLNSSKYNFTKEMQQNYIIELAAPDFEIQSFQEQIINLFNRVHCN